MSGFELKDATLDDERGEGFAVVFPDGDRQRCEGRIVFDGEPSADLMKKVVEGGRLTYEGPVYHGDEEHHRSVPVVSTGSDFESEEPYVDFESAPPENRGQQRRGQGRGAQRGRGKQGGRGGRSNTSGGDPREGEVSVHEKDSGRRL